MLKTTPHHVVVIDKLTYAANRIAWTELGTLPRVELIREDIANRAAMEGVFNMYSPSAVLNLAAETHVDRSIDSAQSFLQTNVVGTFVMLEVAREFLRTRTPGERERFRFLHISTDEVYGTLGSSGVFTEQTPYSPNSPYAASKAAADHFVHAYFETYALPTLVTNCSNNYGPFQHPEKLIPLMILNALQGRRLPIYGDGQNIRDWLHVEDHCSALMVVLEKGQPGQNYNVGASNEQSNLTLVDRLCDALEEIRPARENAALLSAGELSYRDLKQFVTDRPGHDRRYAVNAEKIRGELGWAPRIPFADGLKDTVRWYLDHHDAFDASAVGYDRERLGLGAGKV